MKKKKFFYWCFSSNLKNQFKFIWQQWNNTKKRKGKSSSLINMLINFNYKIFWNFKTKFILFSIKSRHINILRINVYFCF
jgi:hypothetical protein